MSVRNIGVPGVVAPTAKECSDKSCPFHGTTRIRGKITQGVVISKKSKNTVVINIDYLMFIKKYQRYERRHSHLSCHLPECLKNDIQLGDLVKVGESRKVSKNKSFIVLQKLKKPGGAE